MGASPTLPAEPEEVIADLLGLDRGLMRQAYYGEQSVFYNPGGVAALGVMFASIKDGDGPNDKTSNLTRDGVYRFAFQLSEEEYVRRFGAVPARPAKGAFVDVSRYDVTAIGELTPHPVYAWMRWAQILSPTRVQYDALKPLLLEALEVVKAKWRKREGR